MEFGKAVLDAVLAQVIASGHLAAEAVASVGNGHSLGVVGEGVDQDRDIEVSESKSIRNCSLVTEVGERHEDAVDLVSVRSEQVCACVSFG